MSNCILKLHLTISFSCNRCRPRRNSFNDSSKLSPQLRFGEVKLQRRRNRLFRWRLEIEFGAKTRKSASHPRRRRRLRSRLDPTILLKSPSCSRSFEKRSHRLLFDRKKKPGQRFGRYFGTEFWTLFGLSGKADCRYRIKIDPDYSRFRAAIQMLRSGGGTLHVETDSRKTFEGNLLQRLTFSDETLLFSDFYLSH